MFGITEIAIGAENAQSNWQVKTRAFLPHIRRREIDGRFVKWKEKGAVVYRGANALARLTHGQVRQSHNCNGCGSICFISYRSQIDFYIDQVGIDSVNCGGLGAKEHGRCTDLVCEFFHCLRCQINNKARLLKEKRARWNK